MLPGTTASVPSPALPSATRGQPRTSPSPTATSAAAGSWAAARRHYKRLEAVRGRRAHQVWHRVQRRIYQRRHLELRLRGHRGFGARSRRRRAAGRHHRQQHDHAATSAASPSSCALAHACAAPPTPPRSSRGGRRREPRPAPRTRARICPAHFFDDARNRLRQFTRRRHSLQSSPGAPRQFREEPVALVVGRGRGKSRRRRGAAGRACRANQRGSQSRLGACVALDDIYRRARCLDSRQRPLGTRPGASNIRAVAHDDERRATTCGGQAFARQRIDGVIEPITRTHQGEADSACRADEKSRVNSDWMTTDLQRSRAAPNPPPGGGRALRPPRGDRVHQRSHAFGGIEDHRELQ